MPNRLPSGDRRACRSAVALRACYRRMCGCETLARGPMNEDASRMSELIAAGLTTPQIADRIGRHVWTVRFALRRRGLENPNDRRHPRFDTLLADAEFLRHAHDVRGLTVVEIAGEVHRHPAVVIAKLRSVGIRTRQPYIYSQLQDAAWLQSQFDAGGSLRTIAAQVGCSTSAVARREQSRRSEPPPPHVARPLTSTSQGRGLGLSDEVHSGSGWRQLERVGGEPLHVPPHAPRSGRETSARAPECPRPDRAGAGFVIPTTLMR